MNYPYPPRRFRPRGYTGQSGTCLWCGRKLRQRYHSDLERGADGKFHYTNRVKVYEEAGQYGGGNFCGLRCGYDYAMWVVALSKRPKV